MLGRPRGGRRQLGAVGQCPVGHGGQPGGETCPVGGPDGQPLGELAPSDLAGEADRVEREVGPRPGQEGGHRPGVPEQLLPGAGGEHEELLAGLRFGAPAPVAVLLDDQVHVGAAGAEGADPGPARGGARGRPGHEPGRQGEPPGVERDLRVDGGETGDGGDPAVPELKEHLGQRGDAGGALQMPDVGLDGPDGAPYAAPGGGAECPAEAGHLDRVAEFGTGAVRLQVADGVGFDAGPADRLGDQRRLRVGVGHGVPGGLPTGVGQAGPDDAPDLVPVRDGLPQGLEQHRTDALAGYEAVGVGVEHLAALVRGEHVHRAERDVVRGVQDQVHSAGDRAAALTAPDALAGEVDGEQ